jgi:hypothetical protein
MAGIEHRVCTYVPFTVPDVPAAARRANSAGKSADAKEAVIATAATVTESLRLWRRRRLPRQRQRRRRRRWTAATADGSECGDGSNDGDDGGDRSNLGNGDVAVGTVCLLLKVVWQAFRTACQRYLYPREIRYDRGIASVSRGADDCSPPSGGVISLIV